MILTVNSMLEDPVVDARLQTWSEGNTLHIIHPPF